MNLLARSVINIKGDSQLLETAGYQGVILVDNSLRGRIFLKSLIWNSRSVLVTAANKKNILSGRSQVANINIGRDISTCEMANVLGAIGVRQRRCNGIAFKFGHN